MAAFLIRFEQNKIPQIKWRDRLNQPAALLSFPAVDNSANKFFQSRKKFLSWAMKNAEQFNSFPPSLFYLLCPDGTRIYFLV